MCTIRNHHNDVEKSLQLGEAVSKQPSIADHLLHLTLASASDKTSEKVALAIESAFYDTSLETLSCVFEEAFTHGASIATRKEYQHVKKNSLPIATKFLQLCCNDIVEKSIEGKPYFPEHMGNFVLERFPEKTPYWAYLIGVSAGIVLQSNQCINSTPDVELEIPALNAPEFLPIRDLLTQVEHCFQANPQLVGQTIDSLCHAGSSFQKIEEIKQVYDKLHQLFPIYWHRIEQIVVNKKQAHTTLKMPDPLDPSMLKPYIMSTWSVKNVDVSFAQISGLAQFDNPVPTEWSIAYCYEDKVSALKLFNEARKKEAFYYADLHAQIALFSEVIRRDIEKGNFPIELYQLMENITSQGAKNIISTSIDPEVIVDLVLYSIDKPAAVYSNGLCIAWNSFLHRQDINSLANQDLEKLKLAVYKLFGSLRTPCDAKSVELTLDSLLTTIKTGTPLKLVHVACLNHSETAPLHILTDRTSESLLKVTQTVTSFKIFFASIGIPAEIEIIYADDELDFVVRNELDKVECSVPFVVNHWEKHGITCAPKTADEQYQFVYELHEQVIAELHNGLQKGKYPLIKEWIEDKLAEAQVAPSRFTQGLTESELYESCIWQIANYYSTSWLVETKNANSPVILIGLEPPSTAWLLNAELSKRFGSRNIAVLNYQKGNQIT